MSDVDARQTLHKALQLHQAGQPDEAAHLYRQIIARQPNNAVALHYLGVAEAEAGRVDQAKPLMARSLEIEPANVSFIENYATVLCQSGDNKSALQICDRGFRLDSANVALLYASAVAFCKLRRFEESLAQFDKLLRLKPDHIAALNERGSVLAQLNRHEKALLDFHNALKLQPLYAEAYLNLGNLYSALHRYDEAFTAYDKALALKPVLADAWLGRGNLLFNLKRYDESATAYDRALALKPSSAGAWLGRGNVLSELRRLDQAITAYDKAFIIEPDLPFAEGSRLEAKLHCCDWSDFPAERDRLVASVKNLIPTPPFAFLAVSTSAAEQLLCAKLYIKSKFPPSEHPVWTGERYRHDRIRLGYFSADFHEHATAYLAAGLFESHDRTRFEVTSFSFGPDTGDAMRRRITAASEHFIDAANRSDREIALLARDLEIDIAVDLKGLTKDARLGIFALRPAPVQVNYLGYPGSVGADYIDYLIGDPVVIPEADISSYTEKIVHLPNSYQVNDSKRAIAKKTFTRTDAGLPQSGFVFCCYNNNYKINPDVFDCWARILARVTGGVLWLLEDNAFVAAHLRKELGARGVDPARLVFAKRLPSPEHLARHRLADLFLDTLPYNAHTTASDALWVGVPVLTQRGKTFAGRVAASLLTAVGLTELVTQTLRAYEDLAVELATNPARLAAIKDTLSRNRLIYPLFDTARFTRHIETAYAAMHERHLARLPPDHIRVN